MILLNSAAMHDPDMQFCLTHHSKTTHDKTHVVETVKKPKGK